MNKSIELLCAHSIIVCSVFLAGGLFGVAGWMPPLSAAMDAQAVASMGDPEQTARPIHQPAISGQGQCSDQARRRTRRNDHPPQHRRSGKAGQAVHAVPEGVSLGRIQPAQRAEHIGQQRPTYRNRGRKSLNPGFVARFRGSLV